MVGAELLVTLPLNGYSDGVLMVLTDDIPDKYNGLL